MDLTYHLIAGTFISKATTGTPFNGWIIGVSILPDIITLGPYYARKIFKAIKNKTPINEFKVELADSNPENGLIYKLYYFTHSLIGMLLFFFLAKLIFPALYIPISIAYVLHIIIDLPTHSEIWAFRPLYPLSDFKINGKDWWLNKQLRFFMWGILIIAGVALFF